MAQAQPAKVEEAAGRLIMVALADLEDSPFNPRQHYDEADLIELANSIRAEGLQQPVKVRLVNGKPQLVFGHRRKRGAVRAGLTEIPAILVEMDDATVRRVQLIENLQRQNISVLEEAEAFAGLVKLPSHSKMSVPDQVALAAANATRFTVGELAARIGKTGMSESYVRGRLRLTRLPEFAKAALRKSPDDPEALSASTAVLIAGIPNDKLREQACKDFYQSWDKTWVSFRTVKSYIASKYMRQLKGCGFDDKDATLVPCAGACTTCPKRAGNNPLEYPDCREDMCMDTACFDSKLAAARKRQVESFAEKGLPVLDRQASNKILQGKWVRWEKQHEWLLLDDKCQKDKKRRTYRQLLGERADGVTIAQTKDGPVAIIKHTDAARLLAEKHKITLEVPDKPRSEMTPEERAKLQADEQRVLDIRFRAALKACAQAEQRAQAIYGAGFSKETPALLRLLRLVCVEMFDRYNHIAGKLLCTYMKLPAEGRADQLWKQIETALQKHHGQNLLVFQCVVSVAFSLSRWVEWASSPPPRDAALFPVFGIDLGELQKAAKKEIKQEAATAEAKRKAELLNAPPTEWQSPVLEVKRSARKRASAARATA